MKRIVVKINMVELLELIQINRIKVKHFSFDTFPIQSEEGEFEIYFRFDTKDTIIHIKKNQLFVDTTFTYVLKEKIEQEVSKTSIFELSISYSVSFLLTEDYAKLTSDSIPEEFTTSYIPRILHPYFNKEVTDALTKVGLPCISLPLFENF